MDGRHLQPRAMSLGSDGWVAWRAASLRHRSAQPRSRVVRPDHLRHRPEAVTELGSAVMTSGTQLDLEDRMRSIRESGAQPVRPRHGPTLPAGGVSSRAAAPPSWTLCPVSSWSGTATVCDAGAAAVTERRSLSVIS